MRRYFILLSLGLAALSCSGDDPEGDASAAPGCEPKSVTTCACLGSGQGTQVCRADGKGYEPCLGCPGAGGTSGAGGSAGTTAGGTGGGNPEDCKEGNCTGCAACFDICVCQGGPPQSCLEQCAAQGGAGGTGGASGSGTGGSGTGGTGTGGFGGSGTGGVSGSGTGGSGTGGGAPGGEATCGITNPVTCPLSSEKCCVLEPGYDYCAPSAQPCACEGGGGCALIEVACDGPEDCPGQVCCGLWNGQAYTRLQCQASCDNVNELEICHQGSTQCSAPGFICSASQSLPTYIQRCRN